MILILTTEAGDFSHPKIIDWLEYYNADYQILTGESIFNRESTVKIINSELFVNKRNYTSDVNVVFSRRWLTASELPEISNDFLLNKSAKTTISAELYEFRNFLAYNLKNATWIPKTQNLNVNKLTILQKAIELGVKTPSYLVTNDKKEVLSFLNTHKKIITKAIGNFPRNYMENNLLINPIYTKVVTETLLEKLPDLFFMSIFQEYINKKREYRLLYFEGKCFTVEILTQENDFSTIDSRAKKNEENQVRIQKSKLPDYFEKQIDNLMKQIGLNIGSIDVLEDENEELYFLEVNPVGQISGYSLRGNLNYEKEIVKKMILIDNEANRRKKKS